MNSKLNLGKDPNGAVTFLRNPSTYLDVIVFNGSSQNYTIPAGASFLVFSCTDNFWVDPRGGTVSVPVATNVLGTSFELNPAGYDVRGLTSISFIGASGQVLSISVYGG